jgi:hypothetical protein
MSFQKLILLPRSEYEKFNLQKQNKIDDEMSRTIKDKSLTKHERNVQFKSQLNSFINTSADLRRPMEINITKRSTEPPKEKLGADVLKLKMKQIQSPLRRKAASIYIKTSKLGGVTEGEDTVTINGERLGHNLFNYVAEMIHHSGNNKPLAGYEKVVKLLHRAGVKSTTIDNSHYKSVLQAMQKASQKSSKLATLKGNGLKWVEYRF